MSAALDAAAPWAEPTEPHEMIVDLFAGGGGASTAILMATGRHPDVAVNHDPNAVALHAANHPTTRHYCCDVFEVDPFEACRDARGNVRPVGLLWASPDCTHHSKARGGKPADKKIRALAWVVVKWAAKLRPRCIFLENVEEFQDWGPLDADNRPDKARKGEIFRTWVSQLEALGYQVDWRELVAADFGAPTTRKRLFLVARNDGRPITWPEPTHAPRHKLKTPSLFEAPKQPWRPAADIIDWAQPCPSIFDRKKPLAPKTQKRIAKGIRRFVVEAPCPFLVPNNTNNVPKDTAEPVPTVTPGNRNFLTVPSLTPRYGEAPGQEPRTLDIAAPYPTVVPRGNGGDLTLAHLTKFRGESSGADAGEPMPTVTANSYVKRPGCGQPIAPVVAHVTKFSENSVGTDPRDPLHTAMAGAPRHGLVAAHLGRQFGQSVGSDGAEPVDAVTAGGGGKTQVVAAHLGRQFGTAVGRDLNDPHPTVMTDGAGGKSYLSAACLTSYYGTGIGAAADAPLPTVVTKDRHALNAAFLEQANTGVVGHSADEPASTILAAGCHQRPVEARLEPLEGAPGSRRAQVLVFLREHFGEPTEAEQADPLGSSQARLRFGLVLIDGAAWMITDIGMRMLVPRELYGAQGFPADYVIDRTADGAPLTKTAQTRMAGNSVSPPPAAAMIRANDPLLQRQRAAA